MVDEEEMDRYLEKIKNNEISNYQREILNKKISEEEIKTAINTIKLGKATGPDGFTAKIYKRFKEEISTQLKPLFNQILEGGLAPKT